MTKKDFELIAQWVKENTYTSEVRDQFTGERKPDEINLKRNAIHNLATTLGETNPLFNTERFLKACGLEV